jgi:exosome complex component RRP4
MPIFLEKKQLVTPGELLAEGDYIAGDNTYKEDDKILASRVGLIGIEGQRLYVTALKGCYIPSVGDFVIGKVVDISMSGWVVDINAPYEAMLFVSDVIERSFNPQRDVLTQIYNLGDLVKAKVIAYDRTRGPILTTRGSGLGKITRGRVVGITPAKIPRVIGARGSMVNMLKQETNCYIGIGQNGRILVSGVTPEDEDLVILAIRKIEAEAHTLGLTDRIRGLIQEVKSKREGGNVSSSTSRETNR